MYMSVQNLGLFEKKMYLKSILYKYSPKLDYKILKFTFIKNLSKFPGKYKPFLQVYIYILTIMVCSFLKRIVADFFLHFGLNMLTFFFG